jgi:hypothetical protein
MAYCYNIHYNHMVKSCNNTIFIEARLEYGVRGIYHHYLRCMLYQVINDYLQFRERSGERVTPCSPLIREQFDINDQLQISKPKPLAMQTSQKPQVGLYLQLAKMSPALMLLLLQILRLWRYCCYYPFFHNGTGC